MSVYQSSIRIVSRSKTGLAQPLPKFTFGGHLLQGGECVVRRLLSDAGRKVWLRVSRPLTDSWQLCAWVIGHWVIGFPEQTLVPLKSAENCLRILSGTLTSREVIKQKQESSLWSGLKYCLVCVGPGHSVLLRSFGLTAALPSYVPCV